MQPDDMKGHILGHYRIQYSLGYGGTSTVFLAEDIRLQREVAIKVFSPPEGETGDFQRRFVREARVLARLDHPHILPVYEYGEEDDCVYLVIPYMAGGSLRDRLREQLKFSVEAAVRLLDPIFDALQYAHGRGLIHRDVKPGNMLFKADGTLLLADFGMVKVLHTEGGITTREGIWSTTVSNQISGTPDYMAPEQINGQAVPATDIYAMGAVLYELLCGTRLFAAENYLGILMKQMQEQPIPPCALNPQIPSALEAVILRALRKDPAQRYQSAEEMRQAVQKALTVSAMEPEPDIAAVADVDIASIVPASEQTLFLARPTLIVAPDVLSQEGELEQGAVDENPQTPQVGVFSAHNSSTLQDDYSTTFSRDAYHPLARRRISYAGVRQPSKRPARVKAPLLMALILVPLLIVASAGGIILYGKGLFYLPGQSHSPAFVHTSPTPVVKNPSGTASAIAITLPMPPTSTTCPDAGGVRAMVTAALATGTHQNIVYIENHSDAAKKMTNAIIKRHDLATGAVDPAIVTLPDAMISTAQVSTDEQWVLFVVHNSDHDELRMARMDGQGLQTLFCSPTGQTITSVQWSFDQNLAVFNMGQAFSQVPTYLLDLKQGHIQELLIPQANLGFVPRLWIDNRYIYLSAFIPNSDAPHQGLYMLDSAKSANQHDDDLTKVISGPDVCGSFDTSYDLTQLYVSHCTSGAGGAYGVFGAPSAITTQLSRGGQANLLFHTRTLAITTIRAISKTTLLLLVENEDGDASQNGVWRINTDGTGLRRLTTDADMGEAFCAFTQYAWSNASHDGSMFALGYSNANTSDYRIYAGSLASGRLTQVADISDGTQLYLVGWTQMT